VAEELSGAATLTFERKRVHALMAALEAIAAGDYSRRLPLSPQGDELDAIAHAVNVIADELKARR
jgi:methyl-accepting chemotaxis protein